MTGEPNLVLHSKSGIYIKKAIALCMVFCFMFNICTLTARAVPGTRAGAAVLFEANSGTFLYSHNPDKKLPIASITKIMTALVVLENCNMEEFVQFKRQWALTEGSSSGFREGQWYTVRQLLYALMLASGNDAAVALACHTAGSVEEFAELMNAKADELGMTNTSFKNPHGLDQKDHHSTAADMARLTAEAMKNRDFALISSTKEARFGNHRFSNHNKLLWKYPDTVGVKTGYTSSAGRTLVTCVQKNGMTLICVTLNDSDDWNDHILLYDWAGANYSMYVLNSAETFTDLPVIAGIKESVPVKYSRDVKLLIKADDKVTVNTKLPKFIYASATVNEKAGEAEILVNGEPVETVDVLFADSVEVDKSIPLSFWEKIKWSWNLANKYPFNNWRYIF